jgi:hypothetical protein
MSNSNEKYPTCVFIMEKCGAFQLKPAIMRLVVVITIFSTAAVFSSLMKRVRHENLLFQLYYYGRVGDGLII